LLFKTGTAANERFFNFCAFEFKKFNAVGFFVFCVFFFFRIRHLTAESAEVDLLRGNFRRSPVLAENSGSNDRPAGEWEQDVNVLVEINVALKFNNNDNLMSVYTCDCALHCAPVAGNNILKRSENFL